MRAHSRTRLAAAVIAAAVGVAAGAYGACIALAWHRYGRPPAPGADERDALLDRYMPDYEVVERHHIRVGAPSTVTLNAAREQELRRMPLIRAIFRARELVLGATRDEQLRPRGLLDEVQSLGWGVLAQVPDREVLVGAVTRPWEPNVTFRALPPEEFVRFAEPGFVKIAWTLRADPIDGESSIFRTETRAIATDSTARVRFRRYWAFASPGIALIRRLSLAPVKKDAEGRAIHHSMH